MHAENFQRKTRFAIPYQITGAQSLLSCLCFREKQNRIPVMLMQQSVLYQLFASALGILFTALNPTYWLSKVRPKALLSRRHSSCHRSLFVYTKMLVSFKCCQTFSFVVSFTRAGIFLFI